MPLLRQTRARWVGLAADGRRPIYDALRTGGFAGGYVPVDETPIAYLEPGHGSARQGFLWTYARPGADVLFDWQTGRGAKGLEHVMPDAFTGTLQGDGYQAYPAFIPARPGRGKITLAGMHPAGLVWLKTVRRPLPQSLFGRAIE